MSSIKILLKESFAYGFANVVTRFIGFLLMPLYTHILSPDDYGILNVVNVTLMLVTLFSVLGLDGATHVFFWDFKEAEKRKEVFASWFWMQLSTSIFLMLVLLFVSNSLSEKLFDSGIHSGKFRLASLLLITSILPTIATNWFRLKRLPWQTAWFSLSMSLITIGFNILFVAVLHHGIIGFFWAQIISGSIMSIVAIVLMRNWLSIYKFRINLLGKMLKYSLPMVPTPLAFWSLNFAGSYFLQLIKGETEVGLFQTGLTIASIMTLVINSFTQAWGPFAMSIKDDEGSKFLYSKILVLYSSIACLFALLVGVFSNEILYVMTPPAYQGAHLVTSIFAFNAAISGLNFIAALGLNFVKNMKPYSFAIVGGAIFNLSLYFFAIKLFGKEGCAVLTLISNICVVILIFYYAQKLYFIPYDFHKSFFIFILCLAALIFGKIIIFHDILTSVLYKATIILFVALFLYKINKKSLNNFFRIGKTQNS